jgi:hypothetical protein
MSVCVLLPLWEKVVLAQRAPDEGCWRELGQVCALTPHLIALRAICPLPQGERT